MIEEDEFLSIVGQVLKAWYAMQAHGSLSFVVGCLERACLRLPFSLNSSFHPLIFVVLKVLSEALRMPTPERKPDGWIGLNLVMISPIGISWFGFGAGGSFWLCVRSNRKLTKMSFLF